LTWRPGSRSSEIFLASDTATVHMKDAASGPDGFLPFARSVFAGLAGDGFRPPA
jgi:hypothetical protein